MYRIMINIGRNGTFKPHSTLDTEATREGALKTIRERQKMFPEWEYAIREETIGPIEKIGRLDPAEEAWESYVKDAFRGSTYTDMIRWDLEHVKKYFMEGYKSGKND